MNYRHIYHAGNFADVLKHAVLARLVLYMQGKDKAFRVLDTHAGIGLYDLSSEEAQKTGEWRDGIGRLLDGDLPADARLYEGGGGAGRHPDLPALDQRGSEWDWRVH